ncbi:uncharacterized protein LOC110029816 [Phalaenopsis equestris]|uniref:uncharacterized protein LOC110029816 n=1 Tax=Phalaenopsis equestris TaxID=78828 RepID=UPI0009E41445|nr:uncharacterized protein LOC110029816 [Phalaenopsis equestris]
MAMDSSKLFNIISILREAISIPSRSKKLMLSSVLLCLLPNFLLLMINYISIYPLLLNFLMKLYLITKEDPTTPQFFDAIIGLRSDAEGFVRVHILFTILSYIITTISMMMIVHSSLLVYSGKQSTLNDVFMRLKSTWIYVFITCIYFSVLYTGYAVLSVCLITVPMLSANGSTISILIGGLFAMSGRLLSVYLTMVWTVGVVVSVAEEGCFGLEAMWRGGEIVKGRRLEGFLIALMLLLADGVFTGGYGFVGAKNATGFLLANILVLMKLFSYMVYSVFYFECKKEVRVVGSNVEILP